MPLLRIEMRFRNLNLIVAALVCALWGCANPGGVGSGMSPPTGTIIAGDVPAVHGANAQGNSGLLGSATDASNLGRGNEDCGNDPRLPSCANAEKDWIACDSGFKPVRLIFWVGPSADLMNASAADFIAFINARCVDADTAKDLRFRDYCLPLDSPDFHETSEWAGQDPGVMPAFYYRLNGEAHLDSNRVWSLPEAYIYGPGNLLPGTRTWLENLAADDEKGAISLKRYALADHPISGSFALNAEDCSLVSATYIQGDFSKPIPHSTKTDIFNPAPPTSKIVNIPQAAVMNIQPKVTNIAP